MDRDDDDLAYEPGDLKGQGNLDRLLDRADD